MTADIFKNIDAKDRELLCKIISDYFSQDNVGTAYPIYFTIRDYEYVCAYEGITPDRYSAVAGHQDTFFHAETIKDLVLMLINDRNLLIKFDDYFNFDDPTIYDLQHHTSEHELDFHCEVKQEVFKGFFLLKEEAANHLKNNAHHYSAQANVYCCHMWRTYETEALFNILRKIVNV